MGGGLLVRGYNAINAWNVFVSSTIFSNAHIKLYYYHRLSCQSVKCLNVKPCEAAVVPTRVQIARNRIHVACTRAGDFWIIERLIAVSEDQRASIVLPD